LQPLTADLFARAIIASSVSRGEIKPIRSGPAHLAVTREAMCPAAVSIARCTHVALTEVCRILGMDIMIVANARTADERAFMRAQAASMEAIRYHQKGAGFSDGGHATGRKDVANPEQPAGETVPKAKPEPSEAPPAPEVVRSDVVTPFARPAAPKPPRAARKSSKPFSGHVSRAPAIPRGHFIERRNDDVQVIRVKPVTASVARHAQAQMTFGLSLDEAADAFDTTSDALKQAIADLNAKVSA
jgi:hypothetical protein